MFIKKLKSVLTLLVLSNVGMAQAKLLGPPQGVNHSNLTTFELDQILEIIRLQKTQGIPMSYKVIRAIKRLRDQKLETAFSNSPSLEETEAVVVKKAYKQRKSLFNIIYDFVTEEVN